MGIVQRKLETRFVVKFTLGWPPTLRSLSVGNIEECNAKELCSLSACAAAASLSCLVARAQYKKVFAL